MNLICGGYMQNKGWQMDGNIVGKITTNLLSVFWEIKILHFTSVKEL